MRITDLIQKDGIALNVSLNSKEHAIDTLVNLHNILGNLSSPHTYKMGILDRESKGSTAIAEGIAIPHAKCDGVKRPGLVAMTVKDGVDYDSMDGLPSNLFFMIAAPVDGNDLHLEVLSRLSTLLMDEDFRKKLLAAQTVDEFMKIIDQKETEKYGVPEVVATPQTYRILAVTACPTGIAHTYMAAEALEKMGAQLGIPLKAETNGSGGAKNILTKEEIAAADGIIIAADKNVDMARFNGKKVIKVKVADGIHKPQQLIETVLSDQALVYHHDGEVEEDTSDSESVGRQMYKHLMNGVSHMLPFVIGGGILIAMAFLFDSFDSSNPAKFGTGTQLAAFFMMIGKSAFSFMLPVLAGFIAMSIADRPGLAIGFVGGTIASAGVTFTDLAGGKVSAGFLGALAAGFIGGYMMLGIKKGFAWLPKSLEGIKPVLIYPLLGVLFIGVTITAINPLFIGINNVLTDALNSMNGSSKILLGCLLGGMMSVDMGGPVNKSAYLFGTASIISGQYEIMAAVMVGGMVPPLVTAISSTIFRKKFTADEKKAGLVNYIMGMCFISEGAIPFAAADPLRVIPSCIIGSATAGGLAMALGCTLQAPHGGIFVVPVIGNPVGFLLALLVGSVVGALILGLIKKPVKTSVRQSVN